MIMLRRILLYLSGATWARRMVAGWGVARQAARRFVAGETLDDAIQATQALNARHLAAALDYLGESVKQAEDTAEVVATYRSLMERIQENNLDASVSLKLTHLGL